MEPDHLRAGAALVVGASRGIGLALVRRLLCDGSGFPVIATHRPDRVSADLSELAGRYAETLVLQPLAFDNVKSLEDLSALLRTFGGVTLAIHSTGILHEGDIQPEKALEQCDPGHLMRLFEVNSIAPLIVARAILGSISKEQKFTFAALSAMVGSIGDNHRGGWYGYRASKAALNQFIRTLAIESQRRWPRATIVSIHPGTTDTALSLPFQRNIRSDKLYTPDQSAERILFVLHGLNPELSGRFYNWDGTEIPW